MADLTLDDLLKMTNRQRLEVMKAGQAIPAGALDDSQYRGIDLSLPPFMTSLLWKTFRKTFHRDPMTGVLRGWNVRMKQTGWQGPGEPMLKDGRTRTFGHYQLRSGEGVRFPGRLTFPHYLDYAIAGNSSMDPGRFTWSPLVAVNAGSVELLLGWEVFRVAGVVFNVPDFWALKREGSLEEIVAPPRRTAASLPPRSHGTVNP